MSLIIYLIKSMIEYGSNKDQSSELSIIKLESMLFIDNIHKVNTHIYSCNFTYCVRIFIWLCRFDFFKKELPEWMVHDMNVHIFSQLIRPDKTYNVNKLENYLLNLHELYNEITSSEIFTETALEVQIKTFFCYINSFLNR